jgi:uroporphyrinogen-III decarboxylase
MEKQALKDSIKTLFDERYELYESNENKRRRAMWGDDTCPDEYLPGFVAPLAAEHRKEKRVPVAGDWCRIQKSRFLNFDIIRLFKEPLYHLKWELYMDIHRFKSFPDDIPLLKRIPIWMSIGMEPSLFGVPTHYSYDNEPIFSSAGAVINEKSDLSKLKQPDFFKSGMMPLVHQFYQEAKELAPDDYEVIFPKWSRSPFGMACALRDMKDVMVDMIEDPPFVHNILKLVNETRIEFSKWRTAFIGYEDIQSTLLNDEASDDLISLQFYEKFCFPYEKELADFYGHLRWWHSCGPKTKFLKKIMEIEKPIFFTELNWWADDFKKAIEIMDGRVPYQVRVDRSIITELNTNIVRNTINAILDLCGDDNFMIHADMFQPANPTTDDLETLARFIRTTKEICAKRIEN